MKNNRKKIVAGNWKMNKTLPEALALTEGLKARLNDITNVDMVLCPPFPMLSGVSGAIHGSALRLGAQNMNAEAKGAYTGEVSVSMLKSVGCVYVILGHSERRAGFAETNAIVNKKTLSALAGGLTPIVCVGETLQEREAGHHETVVTTQVKESLAGLGARLKDVVVAYEPVWAIGTGKTATTQEAQAMHALIRRVLLGMSDGPTADAIRIQYGGSVKADNARELFSCPDIDGGLIGGASLEVESFVAIVRAAV